MHIKFSSEDLKRRDHTDDLGVEGRRLLKFVLRKYEVQLYISQDGFLASIPVYIVRPSLNARDQC
jgi:hypothetical protein